jgi:hypothetical protein
MAGRIVNIAATIVVLMLCAPGLVFASPGHRDYPRNTAVRRTAGAVRCEDRALAARYNKSPPDFTVQYGCIEHPEMMGGSLGAMLRGENPAAGALP